MVMYGDDILSSDCEDSKFGPRSVMSCERIRGAYTLKHIAFLARLPYFARRACQPTIAFPFTPLTLRPPRPPIVIRLPAIKETRAWTAATAHRTISALPATTAPKVR